MRADNYSKWSLLISIFFTTCYCAHAQTERGSKLIGGTLTGSVYLQPNSPDYNSFSINFNPTFGYFLVKNFALGLSLPLSFSHSGGDSYVSPADHHNSLGYGFAPFVRYYLGSGKLKFFLNAKAGYSFSRSHFYRDDIHLKSKSFYASAGPGLIYFINNNIGLEGLINYNFYKGYSPYSSKSGNITLAVGFQIYLPSKKAE